MSLICKLEAFFRKRTVVFLNVFFLFFHGIGHWGRSFPFARECFCFFFDLVLTPKKKADFFNLVYEHQTQEDLEQKLLNFSTPSPE